MKKQQQPGLKKKSTVRVQKGNDRNATPGMDRPGAGSESRNDDLYHLNNNEYEQEEEGQPLG